MCVGRWVQNVSTLWNLSLLEPLWNLHLHQSSLSVWSSGNCVLRHLYCVLGWVTVGGLTVLYDGETQSKNLKFDPLLATQKRLNRSSPKFAPAMTFRMSSRVQNVWVSYSHVDEISLVMGRVMCSFFGPSSRLQPTRPQHSSSRKIRQKTWFRARMCLLGFWTKIKINI